MTARALPSAVVQARSESLPPEATANWLNDDAAGAYRIGAGDTLLIAVYGHPELAIATYAGGNATGRIAGLLVDNDGTLQVPLLGTVRAAGKTADELRLDLEGALARFIREPSVTVQVIQPASIRYYLLGQFSAPGMKTSDRPLRLLEALTLGGSIQLERASLRRAYVARGPKRLPIDFHRLLRDGDLRQNVRLESGDIVFVPDSSAEQVFIFGGATGSNPAGGAVPFVNGELNLLQALAQVGFGRREVFQGRLEETIVIRSAGDQGTLFVVDAEKILAGEAAPFPLWPGDVVYVPATGMTDFNQALEQLLPSLQTISGLLQPFVQIKFLSE